MAHTGPEEAATVESLAGGRTAKRQRNSVIFLLLFINNEIPSFWSETEFVFSWGRVEFYCKSFFFVFFNKTIDRIWRDNSESKQVLVFILCTWRGPACVCL